MTSKEKNMQSSNVKKQIPLKSLGNKARVLQMEMKLISSTPIRNSEKRKMLNESFQVGSPILRVNSTDTSQINENKSKEVVPANVNSSVKSNSLESKNLNNPKNAPYHHMILYSSDEDANVITRKKLQKKMTKKRKIVPFVEDTDPEISPKHTKTNVDLAEKNHIDKVANGKENNEHEKLINTRETNANKRGANEKRIDDNNFNKKAKRKYTKKPKTDEIITVQRSQVETEVVMCEEVVDRQVLDTEMSPQNKLNKETVNNVLKAKNSVTKKMDKSLQLVVTDNEIDRLENEKKAKLQSNKNVVVETVLKDKQSENDNPKKGSKRTTKLNDVEQNLTRNDNDEIKEISQGTRHSSRRRMVSQAYWIARSNSQSSDYTDTVNLPKNTVEQVSKNKRPKAVSNKTKITRQQKQTREIITTGFKESPVTMSTNPDNVHANGAHNPDEHVSNKPSQNPNSDLDICNNDVQTEANSIHENETKRKPVKQNKKTMAAHSKKQKRSAFDIQEQPESNTSPTDTDNIPSDSLTADLNLDKTAKSGNNTAESIIDNYSFKEIALAQRHLAEIENSKQPEYFGKFPQTYHTHSNNPNLSIGINISNPNFISGVLEIVPSGRKQQEYPKKNNMSFFILEGHAEVCVGNISKILRIGDSFFVPNNTPAKCVDFKNRSTCPAA
ncbi:hypothetical protein CBL_08630 [Carabus blaptoides fortunei]